MAQFRLWSLPSENPIRDDEVHLYRASLDLEPASVARLLGTLSERERQRAERFHFLEDQQRYVAAHGLLRLILARYLGTSPGQIKFDYGPRGKPHLADQHGTRPLHFSLSDSEGLALIGIARGRKVGVDVERIRSDFCWEGIAERFLSAREASVIQDLPVEERESAFYAAWTRKEAYLKATGEGLTDGMRLVDLPDASGELVEFAVGREGGAGRRFWSLQQLDLGPGYTGALVVEGKACATAFWVWPG